MTFRFTSSDIERLNHRHLTYGLIVVWIAGLGRYWDHPHPYPIQALGLGSPLVMTGLCVFLYLILRPLRPKHWLFFRLITFVSLTALPALLYAIPVERFLPLGAAQSVNAWFLFVIAAWRVALLARYLSVHSGLARGERWLALLLPLALIMVALTLLNLEQAVFRIMAGIREAERMPGDKAYGVLFGLSLISFLTSPVLILLYGFSIWRRRQRGERAA
ncbi:MAG: hypothetical protein GY716_01660 [bacterium]|nr:hypothetical protein [bacterium]